MAHVGFATYSDTYRMGSTVWRVHLIVRIQSRGHCNMTTIAPKRTIVTRAIASLAGITLKRGGHPSMEHGLCLMEAVSYFAKEPHSDHPQCACPMLTGMGMMLNDSLSNDEKRAELKPLIPMLVGTRGDGHYRARILLYAKMVCSIMFPKLTQTAVFSHIREWGSITRHDVEFPFHDLFTLRDTTRDLRRDQWRVYTESTSFNTPSGDFVTLDLLDHMLDGALRMYIYNDEMTGSLSLPSSALTQDERIAIFTAMVKVGNDA